jgi:group II intron reverse transcriptase/maturase
MNAGKRRICTVEVSEMQRKLSLKATQNKNHRFNDLYSLLCNATWLKTAFDHIKTNRGSRTAGVDKVTRQNFERDDNSLDRLRGTLAEGRFEPSPVRRVYIREVKATGRVKIRPLGIPTLQDRIVQEAVRMILEPIFEPDFSQYSFGFRPGRSTHQAIWRVWGGLHPHTEHRWVIEGDISSFFDTVSHKTLMRLLKRRIKDKQLLHLIWKFLKSGVMEEGTIRNTTMGTPQGGIISPLLANIYLHELDRYMERYTEMSQWMRHTRPKKGLPTFLYTRYADDFVVLCRGTKAQAEAMKQELKEFLEHELKLSLSWDKTQVTHVKDGFRFLGFQVIQAPGGKGRLMTKLRIPEAAVEKAAAKIDTMLKGSADMSVNAKIDALNSVIRGWCQYYLYSSSPSFMFRKLEYKVFWTMGHWLGRKYKLQMPEVMRRFRKENTFGTTRTTLVLPTQYKWKPLRFRTAQNPYLAEAQAKKDSLELGPPRLEARDLDTFWTGQEPRPGQVDRKEAVYNQGGGRCGICGQLVKWEESELDHIRPRSTFKNKYAAEDMRNLQILHRECHYQKTRRERLA